MMRMLLIEDSGELAETIIDRLRAEGHSVDRERDGDDANDLLRHFTFNLVLLEVNLPGRSGFDVLRSLRARTDATRVIILTARSQIGDRMIGHRLSRCDAGQPPGPPGARSVRGAGPRGAADRPRRSETAGVPARVGHVAGARALTAGPSRPTSRMNRRRRIDLSGPSERPRVDARV